MDGVSWLDHLRSILRAAARVAHIVNIERTSVLVHCSDGWDRTPQARAGAKGALVKDRRVRGEGVCGRVGWAGREVGGFSSAGGGWCEQGVGSAGGTMVRVWVERTMSGGGRAECSFN